MVLKVLEWLVEMDGDERRMQKWEHKPRFVALNRDGSVNGERCGARVNGKSY